MRCNYSLKAYNGHEPVHKADRYAGRIGHWGMKGIPTMLCRCFSVPRPYYTVESNIRINMHHARCFPWPDHETSSSLQLGGVITLSDQEALLMMFLRIRSIQYPAWRYAAWSCLIEFAPSESEKKCHDRGIPNHDVLPRTFQCWLNTREILMHTSSSTF